MGMYLERLEDLSVYYFLSDTFIDASYITIVDGFPEGEMTLPTVAVEAGRIDVREYELGNRDGLRVRRWYIDLFAKTKSQRDEFGYRLLDVLKNGIPVYNYNEGFPPSATPSRVGTLVMEAKSYVPVRVVADTPENLYYRATVSFVAHDDVITEV